MVSGFLDQSVAKGFSEMCLNINTSSKSLAGEIIQTL